jgi:NAD(P)H-dependent FMN reductase
MKIEIISGSPRQNSLTRRVAIYLMNWMNENTPHAVSIIDLKDWDLPHVQHVFVSEDTTPEEFKPLTKRMAEADAFILATPEYNGSYSPTLKNLLDHFPKQHRKPFGIVTASPGAFGGIRAAQQLLMLVPALFGIASPYLLVVPTVEKKFGPSGDLIDESFENKIHVFVTEFLWLAEKVVEESMEIKNQS